MGDAKRIDVRPIAADDARRIVRQLHYSGKVVQGSQLHLGVFLDGRCGGALQFGPSLDKRKIQPLVAGTHWNGFLELNRLAFADWLPRNSESRALGVSLRWIRRTYPWVEWVVSFADATQCGDGTIYRASGFVLTGVKKNVEILAMPDGTRMNVKTLNDHPAPDGRMGSALARDQGARPLPGFQLRYLYFLNPAARARLTVPILPFSEIDRLGARMYRGQRGRSRDSAAAPPRAEGGAIPTRPLHQDGDGDP